MGNEDGRRGLEDDGKDILMVYSEKQVVVSTVMRTRVETKRKENCTGLWVRSRIYSTCVVYSHSVSVQMQ